MTLHFLSFEPFAINRFRRLLFVGVATIVITLATIPARAELTLPALFSSHAVLQKSERVPIWGTASPGEKVTLTLGSATAATTADPQGKWTVTLDLHASGPGPFDLRVKGNNEITIPDVLVGEVWLASGQSNMEFPLGHSLDGAAEVAASANPSLRIFVFPHARMDTPADQTKGGKWMVAGPDTTDGVTAVGYYFAKTLQKHLQTPVGVIESTVGGTAIELWMSPGALAQDETLKKGAEKTLADSQASARYHDTLFRGWLDKYGRNDHPAPEAAAWAAPEAVAKDWKPVTLPAAKFSALGLPDAGAVWIRRKINVPPALAGLALRLDIGELHDFATVYWNGHKISEPSPKNGLPAPNGFGISGELVQAGETTVALRIFTPYEGLGNAPKVVRDNMGSLGIPLEGEWLARTEFVLPPLSAEARAAYPRAVPLATAPSVLFNGMIHPLIPYAIRGAIWYQGESNEGRACQYGTAFPLMINQWRKDWGEGDFPFYFCQIPNRNGLGKTPRDTKLAELRDAQSKALKLPHTGEAVLIDVGESGSIHPIDKKNPGERLARIALAQDYGEKALCSGPVFESMKAEGGKVRVHFRCAAGGLIARPISATYQPHASRPDTIPLVRNTPDSECEGFAVCGSDRVWRWATAKIDGSDVVVESSSVPNPVAVRYAWDDNPIVNLSDASGLPAAPFRTDDYPLSTAHVFY